MPSKTHPSDAWREATARTINRLKRRALVVIAERAAAAEAAAARKSAPRAGVRAAPPRGGALVEPAALADDKGTLGIAATASEATAKRSRVSVGPQAKISSRLPPAPAAEQKRKRSSEGDNADEPTTGATKATTIPSWRSGVLTRVVATNADICYDDRTVGSMHLPDSNVVVLQAAASGPNDAKSGSGRDADGDDSAAPDATVITAAPAAGYVVPPRAAHSSTATSSCSVPRRVVRLDVNDSVLARYASAGAAARELSSILSTNAKGQGEMMGWNQTVTDSRPIGPVTLRVVYASTCARMQFQTQSTADCCPARASKLSIGVRDVCNARPGAVACGGHIFRWEDECAAADAPDATNTAANTEPADAALTSTTFGAAAVAASPTERRAADTATTRAAEPASTSSAGRGPHSTVARETEVRLAGDKLMPITKRPGRRAGSKQGIKCMTEVRRARDGPSAPWMRLASQTKAAAVIGVNQAAMNNHVNRKTSAVPGVDPINGWLCRNAIDGGGAFDAVGSGVDGAIATRRDAAARRNADESDDDDDDGESDSEFERDLALLQRLVDTASTDVIDSDDNSDLDDSGGRTEEAKEGGTCGEETNEEAANGGSDDDDKDDENSADDDADQAVAEAAAAVAPRPPTSRRLAALCGGDEVAWRSRLASAHSRLAEPRLAAAAASGRPRRLLWSPPRAAAVAARRGSASCGSGSSGCEKTQLDLDLERDQRASDVALVDITERLEVRTAI